jgi:serine/threonine protein kinase
MLVQLDTLINLSGYRVTEQIYSGSKTLVFRGIRERDQEPVVIKLMRNEYPTFAEISQFRHQYNITKNLDLDGVVKTYSLESYRNGYALIMEDYGGISLSRHLSTIRDQKSREESTKVNYLLPIVHVLQIAIQLVNILEELHRQQVVHKDIKPGNILIEPSTGEIKLIDFSIASLLPREVQNLTNPNVLEGTLGYISPEQTGRMNRGIDYRTDFYSFGVTLFELFTGHLPFNTDDPIELVHCHIAKQPPLASDINSKIPAILSDILNKLMAKSAEDRYQSAFGLKHDLEECFKRWQGTRNIGAFELYSQDISDRFVIPEKLYGREGNVKTLLAAFERVSQGKTEMIAVAGSSGVGKTVVVKEIHKPIVEKRGYFIRGKYDQFQRDTPLSAFVQAFRDLIGQLLSESDNQIQQWKTKILSALGTQSQVMIDVVPELEQIIGKQPPADELSGTAAENRFNLLFQKFIQVFGTKRHPLVIFLDDLQWADGASLKFIQLLMIATKAEAKKPSLHTPFVDHSQNEGDKAVALLLIGAYRNNEVPETHPLYLTLKEIKKIGATLRTIKIDPLNQGDISRMLAETLDLSEKFVVALTQMVFAKTKGNAFFVHQFLKYLHQEKLITFNYNTRSWEYDIAEIHELSLTDDVVEFMMIQLQRLQRDAAELLELAACLGNEFDLKSLSIIRQKSAIDTASELWDSLTEGLVLPKTEFYSLSRPRKKIPGSCI